MDVRVIGEHPALIAAVNNDEVIINDGQSALDFMATLRYSTDCDCILLNKAAICEDFFKLSTGIAGEVLQKFSNYRLKFAIVGDFSAYTSKPLKDFMFESNKGGTIIFAVDEDEAITKLGGSK